MLVRLGTFHQHLIPSHVGVGKSPATAESRPIGVVAMAAEPSDSGHVRIVGAFAGVGSGTAVVILEVSAN